MKRLSRLGLWAGLCLFFACQGPGGSRSNSGSGSDALNDLLFYTGSAFPEKYHGGAMIAFHGSWNRGNQPEGYQVVFVPFDKQGQYRPVGSGPGWDVFVDGFAGRQNIRSSGEAKYRPMGLAQAADGAVLVVDRGMGRIRKIGVAQP